MARYEVLIKPSARKELEAVGLKKDRQRVVAAILALADDPRPSGCRKLSGRDKYRIRWRDYQAVYSVEDVILVITIAKVGHRLDLSAELARRAIAAGCRLLASPRLAIGSDAHAPERFDFLRLGVLTARRGWATATDILNTSNPR